MVSLYFERANNFDTTLMKALAWDDKPEEYLDELKHHFEENTEVELVVVDDTSQFFRHLGQEHWDFIITELVLETGDDQQKDEGIKVAHRCRNKYTDLPIVLLTGDNDAIDRAQGRFTEITHPRLFCSKDVTPEWIAYDIIDFVNLVNGKPKGNKVFIGHGGKSNEWLKLEKFLTGDCNLEVAEFDNEPAAGKSIKERLIELVEASQFAILILTKEDEQIDGSFRARQNVIHEVGLFQGALGFDNAIVLIEEGCETFSNHGGIIRINFQKDKINAVFHEISRILKDRRIIER